MSRAIRQSSSPVVPPTVPQTPVAESEFRLIPLDQITPSPFQLRRTFDDAGLAELSQSIVEKGVLEPILVRFVTGARYIQSIAPANDAKQLYAVLPMEDVRAQIFHITGHDAAVALVKALAKDHYELVAGERRWRAAKLAAHLTSVNTIPAIVRELSDRDAAEIGAIENLQRADLRPLEEAEGYKMLIEGHGYTADSLAEKLHKSKSYVYGVLKLTGLPEAARTAIMEGKLPLSTAQLIARIPNEKLRAKATEEIVTPKWSSEPQTFRSAKSLIERSYMKELKGAPFDRDDPSLTTECGACVDCSKMTGNNRVEFPDARADICTDPPCFQRKVAAHDKRVLEKAAAKFDECETLPKSKSKKLFDWNGKLRSEAYVELSAKCEADTQKRTFKQLLGDEVTPVVALNNNNKAFYLVDIKKTAEVLKTKHRIKLDVAKPSSSDTDKWAKERAAREQRKVLMNRVLDVAGAQMAKAAEGEGVTLELMRFIVEDVINVGGEAEDIAARRGLTFKDYGQANKALMNLIQTLTHAQLVGLYVEIALRSDFNDWDAKLGERSALLVKMYKVDFDGITREVKAQVKAEEKAAQPVEVKQKKMSAGK